MSLSFLRIFFHRSLNPKHPISLPLVSKPSYLRLSWHCQLSAFFCTVTESSNIQTTSQKQTKKGFTNVDFTNVGRRISHHHVQLLGADGEELGVKHRAEVFQLIDKTGLRLVIINDKCVPPIYRLMKGRDMFEERMKLKEQQKTKKDRAQLKEITISAGISPHDLEIKLKKAVKWLENKHHVKLRINGKRNNSTPLDKMLTETVEKIPVPVSFMEKPSVSQDGQRVKCVLRMASDKDKQKKERLTKKREKPEETQTDSAVSEITKDLKQ